MTLFSFQERKLRGILIAVFKSVKGGYSGDRDMCFLEIYSKE